MAAPHPESGAPADSTAEKAPTLKRVGRISLLEKHPEIARTMANLIASGQFSKDAAAHVGIGHSTFQVWLNKGRAQKRGQYRAFVDLITDAEAKRRILLLGKVTKAAGEPKHWQAATWILTHTDPELFTPNIRVHVTQQLEAALNRLEQEFANEPAIFERILAAIAIGAGVSAPAGLTAAGGEGLDGSGADPDPSRRVRSAARVPSA